MTHEDTDTPANAWTGDGPMAFMHGGNSLRPITSTAGRPTDDDMTELDHDEQDALSRLGHHSETSTSKQNR
ncbi:hypothetical protein ACWDOP_07510 [Nocardia sp. NPDC003693]